MKTTYAMVPKAGKIYCHKFDKILNWSNLFAQMECTTCKYFAGMGGAAADDGDVVECVFENGESTPARIIYDPYDLRIKEPLMKKLKKAVAFIVKRVSLPKLGIPVTAVPDTIPIVVMEKAKEERPVGFITPGGYIKTAKGWRKHLGGAQKPTDATKDDTAISTSPTSTTKKQGLKQQGFQLVASGSGQHFDQSMDAKIKDYEAKGYEVKVSSKVYNSRKTGMASNNTLLYVRKKGDVKKDDTVTTAASNVVVGGVSVGVQKPKSSHITMRERKQFDAYHIVPNYNQETAIVKLKGIEGNTFSFIEGFKSSLVVSFVSGNKYRINKDGQFVQTVSNSPQDIKIDSTSMQQSVILPKASNVVVGVPAPKTTTAAKPGSKQAAFEEAAKLRAQGKTVKIFKESGVRTVPGKGVTPYTIYSVKEVDAATTRQPNKT